MTKVLVIQGAGMNMRGKVQVEIFGPNTLDQINEQIRGYGESLGVDVKIVHSNVEGEVVNALYDAWEEGYDACLINPAGYTTGNGPSAWRDSAGADAGDRGARQQPHGSRHRLGRAAGEQGMRLRIRCVRVLPCAGSGQAHRRIKTGRVPDPPKSLTAVAGVIRSAGSGRP